MLKRSLGYDKASDRNETLSNGGGHRIPKARQKDSRRLRLGKDSAVIRANKELARHDRQFLRMQGHRNPESGFTPTEYELNWEALIRYITEKKNALIPTLVSERNKPLVPEQDIHNHYHYHHDQPQTQKEVTKKHRK